LSFRYTQVCQSLGADLGLVVLRRTKLDSQCIASKGAVVFLP